MDITDKHRLLVTTTRQQNVTVQITDALRLPSGIGPVTVIADTVTEQASSEPAEETDISPITSPQSNTHFEYAFDILFDEPGVVEGEPVIPFLRRLIDATNDVVSDFSKLL